jgi:hypothetical protein
MALNWLSTGIILLFTTTKLSWHRLPTAEVLIRFVEKKSKISEGENETTV